MASKFDDGQRSRLDRMVADHTRTHGLELVDLELIQERSSCRLVLTVDHDQGVPVDACAKLSRCLSSALESDEVFAQTFALEVGSPGLTRPLKKPADYARFEGRLALVHFTAALEGKRRLRGRLAGYDAHKDLIRLSDDATARTWEFPRSAVAKARLDFDFPGNGRPSERGEP